MKSGTMIIEGWIQRSRKLPAASVCGELHQWKRESPPRLQRGSRRNCALPKLNMQNQQPISML
jgi:hypothetical protein